MADEQELGTQPGPFDDLVAPDPAITEPAPPPPPEAPAPHWPTPAPNNTAQPTSTQDDGYTLADEVAALASCMLSQGALIRVTGVLAADDFSHPHHRAIYEAILELHVDGEPVDGVTVRHHLGQSGRLDAAGGAALLASIIASDPVPANAGAYARAVRECSLQRRWTDLVRRWNADPGVEVRAEMDQVSEALIELRDWDSAADANVHISEVLERVEERARRIEENPGALLGVPTGLTDLDAYTQGFQAPGVYTVGGRPAQGKSIFASEVARRASQRGYRVLMFNLEMSSEQVVERIICAESGIPKQRIDRGQLGAADWDKWARAAATLAECPLEIEDNALELGEIRSRIDRAANSTEGVDLVIIDYLQLIEMSRPSGNRQEDVSIISRAMKKLAKRNNLAIVQLSQVSRKVEDRADKRPQLADLRESGAIEQDSDVVGFVYRDEVYNPESPDRGTMEFIFAKNRSGPTGTVRVAAMPHRFRLDDLARQQNSPEFDQSEQSSPF